MHLGSQGEQKVKHWQSWQALTSLGACLETNPEAGEKRAAGLQAERLYGLASAEGLEHALCLVDAAGTIAGTLDCV